MSEENNLVVSLDTWLTDVDRNIQKYEFYRRPGGLQIASLD